MEPGTNRRRVAVRWSSAPEAGDAAAAAADLDAWLAARAAVPGTDWAGLAGALQAVLRRVCAEPLLTGDPEVRALLVGLAEAQDGADLAAAADALAHRAAALLPEAGDAGEAWRLRI